MKLFRLSLLSVAVFGVICAPASAAPLLGIGEQRPELLSSTYFQQLGVRQIRLTVPWDAIDGGWQLGQVDAQMNAVKSQGLVPLVIFGHSRIAGRKTVMPSAKAFSKRFARFRSRYPWVRQYGSWNEANYKGQPTFKSPKRVASYYRSIKKRCPKCRVLIASLLDTRNLIPYARSLARAARVKRPLWGFHNYGDISRRRDKTTRKFLGAVKGDVWLVEVGALAYYRGDSEVLRKRSLGEANQAQAISFLTNKIIPRNQRRIKRAYIYQWQASADSTWDSGLMRPDGSPRPAFDALLAALGSGRLRAGS